MRRLAGSWIAVLLMVFGMGAAGAHEGHEHEQQEPPPSAGVAPAADAPRLSLSSSRIELVAVRDHGALLIYVDDYNSNAPFAGLQVQAQSGSRSVQAAEVEAGLYRIDAGVLDSAQALPLRFVISAADWREQLDGVLPAASSASTQQASFSSRIVWLLVPLALLLVIVMRRRHRGTRS